MHESLSSIPQRILELATGALSQANHHAIYYDPGMDHWSPISVVNTAQAGELFLKAIIAKVHPLLIFRDLFSLDDPSAKEVDLDTALKKGRTYSFGHLPKLLRVITGERMPDMKSFEELQKARNAIQHFCAPDDQAGLQDLSLRFIYNNLDPLIEKHFGLYAIEFHEDEFYDYIVSRLLNLQLPFSVPPDFSLSEIPFEEELSTTDDGYRELIVKRLSSNNLWEATEGRLKKPSKTRRGAWRTGLR